MNDEQKDTESALISRIKMAPTGWTYEIRGIEIKTSTSGSLINLDHNGISRTDAQLKFYGGDGLEITDPSLLVNCEKTILDITPSYDFEIIGGYAKIATTPTNNVRISVIAVPDIPAPNGSKVMVSNINFRMIRSESRVEADGRTSKRMTYNALGNGTPTNRLRFVLLHPPGEVHEIAIYLEHYKL